MAALNQNLNRAFDLLELNAGERNQLPSLLQEDFEQVLRRPIETAGIIGMWRELCPAEVPCGETVY
jgi:hypothetical protein